MKSQQIAPRANANHFSHDVNSHDHPSSGKLSSSPSRRTKKPSRAPMRVNLNEETPGSSNSHPESSSGDKKVEITFRLDAPLAHEVLLVGEFTDWEKTPVRMIKGGGGVWHTKMHLALGRHHYRFVVDGQWQDDPNSQTHVPNPFGTFNSVVQIG